MSAHFEMRDATAADGAALARIYNHYIRETVITFEVDELTDAAMSSRVAKIQGAGLPWLVAEGDGTVQHVDGDLKASIPLIGGKIERAVLPAIEGAIRVEERESKAWLAGS